LICGSRIGSPRITDILFSYREAVNRPTAWFFFHCSLPTGKFIHGWPKQHLKRWFPFDHLCTPSQLPPRYLSSTVQSLVPCILAPLMTKKFSTGHMLRLTKCSLAGWRPPQPPPHRHTQQRIVLRLLSASCCPPHRLSRRHQPTPKRQLGQLEQDHLKLTSVSEMIVKSNVGVDQHNVCLQPPPPPTPAHEPKTAATAKTRQIEFCKKGKYPVSLMSVIKLTFCLQVVKSLETIHVAAVHGKE